MFISDLFFKIREVVEVSPAKRDRLIFISFIISITANLLIWLLIPLFFWQSKEYIVLQYNMYFGISSLGPWPMLFLMPLFGLIVGLLNYSLSFFFYLKDKILSLFLATTVSLFQLIILVALGLIIYVNF